MKIIQFSLLIMVANTCIGQFDAQVDPFLYRSIKKDTLPVLLHEEVVDDHLRSKIFSRSGQHLLTLDTYKDSIRIRHKHELVRLPEGFEIDSVCPMPFVDLSTDSLWIPSDPGCRFTFNLNTDTYTVELRKEINDILMWHLHKPISVDHDSKTYRTSDRPPDLYGGVWFISIDRPGISETFHYSKLGRLNGYDWVKPLPDPYLYSVTFSENEVSVIDIWEKYETIADPGFVDNPDGNVIPREFFPEAFRPLDSGLLLLKIRYLVEAGSVSYYHKAKVIAEVFLGQEDKFENLRFLEPYIPNRSHK